jgi:DNA polymerase-3 subunit epsilon
VRASSTADGGGCFPTGRHYPGIAHLLRVVAAGLADEWAGDSPVGDIKLVSIDTETTGRDPAADRIIEIACVVFEAGQIVGRHTWLVNPGVPIPAEAFEVHGIGEEEVKNCPPFAHIAAEVVAVLAGAVPVAYNAEFDRDFLHAELARAALAVQPLPSAARKGIEWIDPLVWARELHRDERSKSLVEVCERLGIPLEKAHRALHDAEAALEVFRRFRSDPRVPSTYAALIQEQRRLGRIHDDERQYWQRAKPA